MAVVHQFVPVLAEHDAVGNHARHLRAALDAAGIGGHLFADSTRGSVTARPARRLTEIAADDVVVYHSSTRTDQLEVLEAIGRRHRLVIDFHNITPAEPFAPWDGTFAAIQRSARRQLARLAGLATHSFAVSAFNAGELSELGARPVSVTGIVLDPADFASTPDAATETLLGVGGGPAWLFVGRVAPHKGHHDLLKAFAVRHRDDATARLWIVGSSTITTYDEALRSFADQLGIAEAVTFAGSVSRPALAAYYRAASVFVSLSTHEGFCVPLVEAMHHRLPVVARSAAAVPETAGDAALLLADPTPSTVAAAVDRVLTDEALATRLRDAGTARLASFDPSAVAARYVDELRRIA